MVYHSQQTAVDCDFACGLPLLPIVRRTQTTDTSDTRDIVDEVLYTFRANILFRTFEVKGAADKLLIYLTLFVCQCLKRTLLSPNDNRP